MTLRILAKSSPGDAITLGSDDYDNVATLFNNLRTFPSFIIYKSGSTYYARNGLTGALLATTSTTDASLVINAAIVALPAIGGKILIVAGTYDCKTTIAVNILASGKRNTEIEGEGPATFLDFTPASTLTDGILIAVPRPGLSNIRIRGNLNVVNLVHAKGDPTAGTGRRHDYGYIHHVKFDGANCETDGDAYDDVAKPPITGQVGLYMEGGTAGVNNYAIYQWRISHCDFALLDYGIWCHGFQATSTLQSDNASLQCNETVRISSYQHNITNWYIQGTLLFGKYGIHLLTENTITPSHINISNINCELPLGYAETTAALYIEPGCQNIRYNNVVNAVGIGYGTDVIDDSNRTDFFRAENSGNVDLERDYLRLPHTTSKRYGWFDGYSPPGVANGILAGRLADFGPTVTNVQIAEAMARWYLTPAASTIMGTIFTSNILLRSANPVLKVMISLSYTDNERLFVGFTDVVNPTSIISTTDMLNTPRKGVGFWIDTGVSANWKVMSNNGTGASTVADLSTAKAVSNAPYILLEIYTDDDLSRYTLVYGEVNTTTKIKTIVSGDVPATTDIHAPLISYENIASGARQMFVYSGELRTSK